MKTPLDHNSWQLLGLTHQWKKCSAKNGMGLPPFLYSKKNNEICSNYANSCRSLCGQSSRSEAERVHCVWTKKLLPMRELLRNNIFVWNKNQSFQTSAFTTTTNRPPTDHPQQKTIRYIQSYILLNSLKIPNYMISLHLFLLHLKSQIHLCWLYQANCELEILRRTKKEVEAHWSFRASLPLL